MAGKPWIKWVVGLGKKWQIIFIAKELGISRQEAAGRCMELFEWAEDQTEDGNVHGVTYETVNALQALDGFAENLEKVGWISLTKKGIKLADFQSHNGQLSKLRGLTSKRVAKSRIKKVTPKALPEKSNNNNKNKNIKTIKRNQSSFVELIPDELNTSDFIDAWVSWENHRKEIRKPLTATSVSRQFKKFINMGVDQSVQMIHHTIEKGWQGLVDPNSTLSGLATKKSDQDKINMLIKASSIPEEDQKKITI